MKLGFNNGVEYGGISELRYQDIVANQAELRLRMSIFVPLEGVWRLQD